VGRKRKAGQREKKKDWAERERVGPEGKKEKERREKGRWAGGSRFGPRGELGRGRKKTGRREQEREGRRWVCFFKTFSNPFQTLNSFQSLNTSNLLQVFKLF
jgi:hypothetical protein